MIRYPEAIIAYQKVFETKNTNSEYYLKANYGLGYAYYNIRNYSNARIYLKGMWMLWKTKRIDSTMMMPF